MSIKEVANSPSMVHATSPQPRGAAISGAKHASHVTNPREASPYELERDTWTSHGSMGPPERLNRLKNTCTSGTDLRTHRTATWRKYTLSGAYRGWPPLRDSMWWLLIVPQSIPGVFGSS
jgi:hypothetical protein